MKGNERKLKMKLN